MADTFRALVTGGAGFIGSTLVDRLLNEGHTVDVVDNLFTGSLANMAAANAASGNRFNFYQMDVRSPDLLDIMVRRQPEVVFHLAAQADVRVSVADPVLDADINIIGSLRVLEGARQAGTRKVVFASSGGTIYGSADRLPVDEEQPQRPLSPYGVAKKAVGDYLFAYQQLHGLSFAALALANVYGPRQNLHGEAGVVAMFAGRLLAGQPCVIYGDGRQTRDFVYVDDVVDAFYRAASHSEPGLLCNIGTGTEISVNDLYAAMARNAGVIEPPVYASARPGEIQRSCLSHGLAALRLGWEPQTGIEEGTAAVLSWCRAQTQTL
jgi:UDP-glucose 4-epimerase